MPSGHTCPSTELALGWRVMELIAAGSPFDLARPRARREIPCGTNEGAVITASSHQGSAPMAVGADVGTPFVGARRPEPGTPERRDAGEVRTCGRAQRAVRTPRPGRLHTPGSAGGRPRLYRVARLSQGSPPILAICLLQVGPGNECSGAGP